jgi:hypothetical protein
MAKFAYQAYSAKVETMTHSLQIQVDGEWIDADEIGKKGWELVGFMPGEKVAVFKADF